MAEQAQGSLLGKSLEESQGIPANSFTPVSYEKDS